jgi:CBS domain containing-hemolysin-like protein
MELKEQNLPTKSKKISISVVLYIIATVIALIGIALLIDNVILFKETVSQYTAKKIPLDTVLKQLIPVKLLPEIFEPIGLYGGIASILFGIGTLNKKFSEYLTMITKTHTCDTTVEEGVLDQNVIEIEKTEK